ncbi:MAG: threonylcarbamoyl-AMP synthase [Cytophagales bacterium]|nr:MAG: threonylcarbamoyl-AMP synthase [Cytophagales bacterium]
MKAKYINIHPLNPQANKIEEVVSYLRKGAVIIYPTDTVYGIGCDIHNQKAVERVCQIKNINPSKINLSFICYDLSHISEYTRNLPTPVFKLMKKSLPGPYTFILNAGGKVPKMLHTKKNTVGIRIPNHTISRTIVKELGNPLLSTSVPMGDEVEYLSDPEFIFEKFEKLVDVVIDGGIGNIMPSTIIDCTSDAPVLIREGLGSIEGIF